MVRGEWLLKEGCRAPGRAPAENIIHVVRRDVEEWQGGLSWSEAPAELASLHSRHDDVGDYKVDPLRPTLDQLQRLSAMRRFQRTIALAPEDPAHEVTYAGLVVDDEHHGRC